MLPEPPARRSKFYSYFGKIIVSPVKSKCSTVGRGFDSPLVQCRSVFSCVWACVFWVSPVGLSWINWAFVLRFRFSACSACVYHSFECTFGPLSLGRSLLHQLCFRFTFPFFWMYRMRLSLFWVLFWPHCRSVGLSVPFEKGSSGSFGFASTVAR